MSRHSNLHASLYGGMCESVLVRARPTLIQRAWLTSFLFEYFAKFLLSAESLFHNLHFLFFNLILLFICFFFTFNLKFFFCCMYCQMQMCSDFICSFNIFLLLDFYCEISLRFPDSLSKKRQHQQHQWLQQEWNHSGEKLSAHKKNMFESE